MEQAKEKNEPLYVCFVDLRKAFDSVPQALLWKTYEEMGIPSQLIRAVQILYKEVYVAVRTAEGLTAWFLSNLGVRQGCVHSPTAFAIFMHKLYVYMKERHRNLDAPTLFTLVILLLLFANDIAHISRSVKGL